MATQMLQRRGTAAQFASIDPVLAEGEFGIEIDTGVVKVGDGVTLWSNLNPSWLTPAGGSVSGGLILEKVPTEPTEAVRYLETNAVHLDLQDFKSRIHEFLDTSCEIYARSLQSVTAVNTGPPVSITWTDLDIGAASGWDISTGNIVVPKDGQLIAVAGFMLSDTSATGQGFRAMYVDINGAQHGAWEWGMVSNRVYPSWPLVAEVAQGDVIEYKMYASGANMTHDGAGAWDTFFQGYIL